MDSNKIKNMLNFSVEKTIDDAVKDLIYAFKNKHLINPLTNEDYFNIKKMQNTKLL